VLLAARLQVANNGARVLLDSALTAPCPEVERPAAAGYVAWQEWAIGLLHQYATCAARHAKTVQAWRSKMVKNRL